MKRWLLVCSITAALHAQKTKITLFNESSETILVSIDTEPLTPLQKNSINPGEAKNFFLPYLSMKQPYYIVIESSSENEPKMFMMKVQARRGIVLERQDYVLGTLPALILNDPDRFIKIVYRGSIRPEIPEISFVR